MAITAGHKLLTGSWTANVEAVEAAISGFPPHGSSNDHCHVALFEIVGDSRLHVNVTHRYATKSALGWAGPGSVAEGFVHNRTFGTRQSSQLIRHIRDMVFATRT
jgi:hypothetical protein